MQNQRADGAGGQRASGKHDDVLESGGIGATALSYRRVLFDDTASQWRFAEVIAVLRGDPAHPVIVRLGDSIVIETDQSLVESVVANPSVAGLAMISEHALRLSGERLGRTTLSVIDVTGVMTSAEVMVQRAPAPPGPVTLPAPALPQSIDVVNGQGVQPIDIEVGTAVVITTDAPFADIAFGDSSTIFGTVMFDQTAYLIGAKEGMAEVWLIRADGMSDTRINVAVVDSLGSD